MPKGENVSTISKNNAEHYIWGKNCDGWHLAKSKNLSVIQERVPGGCFEVRHIHNKSEQFFFILSGIATIELDGTDCHLEKNQGLYIPAGVTHQLKNRDEEDLCFLVISTPPSHGDRIEV